MTLPLFNEWGVRCQSCRYSRSVGKAPFDARRLARRHAHQHADHTVEVVEYVVKETWEGFTPQLTAQLSHDEPPF